MELYSPVREFLRGGLAGREKICASSVSANYGASTGPSNASSSSRVRSVRSSLGRVPKEPVITASLSATRLTNAPSAPANHGVKNSYRLETKSKVPTRCCSRSSSGALRERMRATSSLRSRNDSLQFRTNSATPPEGHPTSYVRFALGGRRCPALHEQIRLPGGLFLLPLVAITLCERELWARELRVTGLRC
jgi:hypothetical protein